MSRDHQIQIVPTWHPSWPSKEYTDWWVVAYRQRFLTQDRLLQDPRGFQLPGDVPPVVSQARDPIVLPRDAPARGRWVRMQRPDIRQKGEGAPSSGREDPQLGEDDEDEEAEYARQEDIPEGGRDQDPGGEGRVTHDGDLDFFSGADVDLARFMEYGGGSGSGSGSQPEDGVPPSHRYGPPSDMQSPLCSLTLTIPSRVRVFSTTSPRSRRSFTVHHSSSISCPRRIARRTTSHHRSRRILRLHGLSHITSPPSATTHRPRSPSTTIRRTRLSAHGHSGHRGIAIRPPATHHHISIIVRCTRATGTM
ncbi:hypothetical protein PIB30_084970 [Stylosanthes scabra]|uniref:Uncharacterized protein n=1 Tax=Stylosanthes scabra TaxID=79078 RepID=A0ABU6RSW6_9FABA|nr:hypothetical protein [Stylosanthes scabra]